jgi:hypothetical protein
MLTSSSGNTMADSLDKLAERLARLEVTVAEGFHDTRQRFQDLDERVATMGSKFDIQTEAIREDLQKTAATLNVFAEESRRTAESMRKEHAADRAVLTVTLQQHARRIYDLENK